MKCPNCSRENSPVNQFCIFCGTRLPRISPEPQPPAPQSLDEEVRQLRESVRQLGQRLTALERRGTPQFTPGSTPPEQTAEYREAEVLAPPVPTPARQVEYWAPAAPPPQAPVKEKPPGQPREWEQILGGNWLARIGVVALLLGIGFFLKFAFDRNWIIPVVRILLGAFAGLLMLGGGYLWRKRYPVMTQVLTGGGIGVLYLTIFASFATYDLIPFIVAVVLLVVTCIVSVLLALRYNSMALAILGIIGAFIAPFVLGAFHTGGAAIVSTGGGYEIPGYILIINIGVLVVSTFRNWRWFILLALVFSLVIYGYWYGTFGDNASLAAAEIFLTLLFLIFVGATTLFHIIWRKSPQAFDYILMVLNATGYATISASMLWVDYRQWMGAFFFLLSLFFAGLAYFSFKRTDDKRLSQFALGIALVLFSTAVPVQFGNVVWTTGTWAAQAAVLIWLSLTTKSRFFRVFGYISFGLVAIRLLFFDSWLGSELGIGVYYPVFNDRMLAFIIGIIAVYIASYLIRRYKEEHWQAEHAVFFVAGNIFTLWLCGIEVADYSVLARPTVGTDLSLLFLFALAAVTILNQLVWRRESVTSLDFVLLFGNAIIFSAFSAFLWGQLRVWMGCVFLALSMCHIALVLYFIKKKTGNPTFMNCAIAISAVLFTVAAPIQFGDRAWTTITWALEGAVLVWLAYRLNMKFIRYTGYGAFIITAFRLLIFDTPMSAADYVPVVNERFLAYAIGIAALYIAGYFVVKSKTHLSEPESRATAPVFFIAANFLTLWLFTAEVLNTFDLQLYNLPVYQRLGETGSSLQSFQNLSVTALWAIYAVVALVIGIFRRIRFLRLGALTLLIVTIGKVFFYDIWTLAMVYRIIGLTGFGLLLLGAGYLYQRHRAKIVTFLKE